MAAMSWLWIVFTISAAAAQTARSAMQRELTATLGTVGATHVRFLFGFPFVLLFLTVIVWTTGSGLPNPTPVFWIWTAAGALLQIAATALMLATMEKRSFVISIAYIKTEPVFVAAFGLAFLKDPLTLGMAVAIAFAVAGVLLISVKPKTALGGIRPAVLGLSAGACFAASSVAYRGGILALHGPNYVTAATFTLAAGVVMQTVLLTAWLAARDRPVLTGIARQWKQSLFAGFMGAVASNFWFLAFALASAASVRTLGLVEVLFAQGVSHIVFKQRTTLQEIAGVVLLVGGAILLIYAHR
jgi:drug/metabolite transporter (DMT)-like permease